jgi:hypothetical protein
MLVSCQSTDQEKKNALNRTQFDAKVIQSLDKYTSLKDFLLNNLDTIINYRNSLNIVTYIGANSNIDSIAGRDEDCWDFSSVPGAISFINNVPSFIYPKLDSLIKDLDQVMFEYCIICKDGTMEFHVRYIRNYSKDINVLHELTWNKLNEEDEGCEYQKDTLPGAKWDYKICVYAD